MIFSFSPFHFPFIEIQSRILREHVYLFIYAFSTFLNKDTGFSSLLHILICVDGKQ